MRCTCAKGKVEPPPDDALVSYFVALFTCAKPEEG